MIAHAVCLRAGESGPEVLLVRTSSGKKWTFPHGHVKPHETPASASVRELAEEAGYQGYLASSPFLSVWEEGGERVEAFLVKDTVQIGAGEPGREPRWFTASEAKRRLLEGGKNEEANAIGEALGWDNRPSDPASLEPFEGRWCPHPDCRGLLAYRRRHRGDSFQTVLRCWSCGWEREVGEQPAEAEREQRS